MSAKLHRSALALLLAACGGDDSTDSTVAGTSSGSASVDSGSATTPEGSDGESSAPSTDGSVDASASSDSITSETATTEGTAEGTTGGMATECNETDHTCAVGDSCRLAACCEGVGYCVSDTARTCGGFIGTACPDSLVCMLDACVADGDGRCVDAETAAALQAQHPGCWNE